MEGYPFEFCFWVYRTAADKAQVWLFCSPIHDEEAYGGHWKFRYSGPIQIVSPSIRQKAETSLNPGHTTRGGFFLCAENFPQVEPPYVITDSLDTTFRGYFEFTFSPQDPDIQWASHYEEELGGEPIVYEVLGEEFFGRIHFTGLDTAVVMAFTVAKMAGPTPGECFNFGNNPAAEAIGFVQSAVQIGPENVARIFGVGV
jgi:hypothetical protein